MIEHWDYLTAWLIYLVAGGGMCYLLWRVTGSIRFLAFRDLLRWVCVVLLFTPWSAGAEGPFLAPAIVVFLIDLLFGEGETGAVAGLVLLGLVAAVVLLLTARALWRQRRRRTGGV